MSGPDEQHESLAEVRSITSAKRARIREQPVESESADTEPTAAQLKHFFEKVLGADVHYLDAQQAKRTRPSDPTPEEISRSFQTTMWRLGLPYPDGTPTVEQSDAERALWTFALDERYPDTTRQSAKDQAHELMEARLRAGGFYDEEAMAQRGKVVTEYYKNLDPDGPLPPNETKTHIFRELLKGMPPLEPD